MLQKVKLFFSSIKKRMKQEKQSVQSEARTDICKICFNPIEQNSFHYLLCKSPTICHECLLKLNPVLKSFNFEGIECFHIYFYTEKIQELLYQFKGCKDYELKSIFLEYYSNYLNYKFNRYTIIPAPSHEKSDKERGFNHVEEIFSVLKLKTLKCIHKTKQVKQADLTTKEREKIGKVLRIDDVNLKHKKVLLVDDVFTTGSTIKSMIKLVKEKGVKNIKVLLMSKTIDLEKR